MDASALYKTPDINALATEWHLAAVALREAKLRVYKAELAIAAHMHDEQATALPARVVDTGTGEISEYLLTYKAETLWDQNTLAGLREHLSPQAWDALLTNPEPPPRVVNLTKVKQLAKAGGEPKKIIDKAQSVGASVLKISEVKP